ncbi:MAG: hypothetical protein QOG05_2513, partial [Streptosporangiaceae bacterium]|nr:hypothetical protein [Streptosporangiaceae bacterium]
PHGLEAGDPPLVELGVQVPADSAAVTIRILDGLRLVGTLAAPEQPSGRSAILFVRTHAGKAKRPREGRIRREMFLPSRSVT